MLKSGLGAGERTRTSDPRITNALLYQLSYPGVEGGYVNRPKRRGNGFAASLLIPPGLVPVCCWKGPV